MFCPACGVRNEEGVVKCFVCGKVMPGVFDAPKGAKQAPARPVRVPVADPTAALGDRMIAMILDTLLLGVVIGALTLIIADRWDLFPQSLDDLTPTDFIGTGAIAAIVALLYFWLLEGLFGVTLGKSLIGIRIQDAYGDPVSLREALVRTLLRFIDGLGFYFVGLVVAVFSRHRKRIGDHAAGTVVVNGPPSNAARAGVLVLWLVLIAAPVYAVWKMVEPVRTWVGAQLMQHNVDGSPPAVPARPTELTLDDFAFLATPEGPIVETTTFAPGDRVWARYTLTGFARDEKGGVNILTESSAIDPAGEMVARPEVATTLELQPDKPLERVDLLQLPRYAPDGLYELRVRVRDLSRGRDATFVQQFEIDAPDVTPAETVEVRNFVFSIAENGFPVENAMFDVGETVHYRFEIHGLQFVDDRIDAVTAYRFIGPDGRTIYATPKWQAAQESHGYHPPTFYIVQSGSVSLPSDAGSGDYTLEHVITDRQSKQTATHVSQFKLR